jgi:hypothetical protein
MDRLTVEEGIEIFRRTDIRPIRTSFLRTKGGERCGCLTGAIAVERHGWTEARRIREEAMAARVYAAGASHTYAAAMAPVLGSLIGFDASYAAGLDAGFCHGDEDPDSGRYRDEIIAARIALIPDPARFTEGVEDGRTIASAVFDTAVAAEAKI